jgi:cell division protease FtsH
MSNQIPEKPEKGPTPPQLPNRFSRSLVGWVIIGTCAVLVVMYVSQKTAGRKIPQSQFMEYVKTRQLTGELHIRESQIDGENPAGTPGLKAGEPNHFTVTWPAKDRGENFSQMLNQSLPPDSGVKIYYEAEAWWEGMLTQMLILLAVFFLIWFLLFRRLGAAAGGGGFLGNFGRSRHRVSNKESPKVTFNDVAGIDEAKDEVGEIIEFLKNPRKFQRLGGRIPRGVLLVGEPGCGKTLLAKAIAGEAEVPFFSISGSDFVEMFVGVGASRVRDLFKQAKDSAPCIIFLDEIDAVGRRRGLGFNGGGHDEREQTLNAILVEMDGFDSSDQVIVIAATNRMDVLDPALTRPGRFDRQINVPLPDLEGRMQILKIYVARIKAGPDVNLQRLARGTPMFSGADLAALVNEAAIAATMAEKDYVEQTDLEEARDKVRWGRARKSRVIDEKEKEITGYHEAGHALVQVLTPGADPLHKVSIIPRGQMGGATFSLPEKDRYLYTRTYCQALLRVLMGGRLAEQIFCNDISSGASNDISQATEIARRMVLDWGMSDKLGPVRYSNEDRRMLLEASGKEYSDKTAEVIDQEIKRILDQAYSDTREILTSNHDKLQNLAQALLKYETLGVDDVKRVLEGKSLDKPTVGDLLDREHTRAAATGVTLSPPPVQPTPGALPEPG